MKCPACDNDLSPVKANRLTVDVCLGGCGGIWFDNFELRKLEEGDELASDFLVQVNVADSQTAAVDYTRRRNCPKCSNIVMMRHFLSSQRRVEVDECPNCGGYWLDAGELALVREEHQAEVDRKRAVDELFHDISHRKLQAMRAEGVQQRERAGAIDRMLSFSRPIRFERQGRS